MKTDRSNKKRVQGKNLLAGFSPQQAERVRWLTWLVEFAQGASDPRDTAEIRRFYQELIGYLNDIWLRHKDADHGGYRLVRPGDSPAPEDLPMLNGDSKKRLDEKLGLFRAEMRWILDAYLTSPLHPLRVEGEIAALRVLESQSHGDQRLVLREDKVADDVGHAIKFQLLGDLAIAGPLLRRCAAKGCSRIFIRRYRQEFCSASCRNRTNFGKWYHGTRKTRSKPGSTLQPATKVIDLPRQKETRSKKNQRQKRR